MKIKSIILNTEAVQATLDGRKSCTRRLVKSQPDGKHTFSLGFVTDSTEKKELGCFGFGTDKNCSYEKYPKSLKMAHDIAMRNYSFVISPEDRKEFDEIVNQEYYKKLEYSGSDYIIVAPKSIEDIIQDAKKLRHCGDSYIIPLLQGRTNLYFMRKKAAPEKPWITIEVKDNTVEQYACFGDELPEKDVVNRINEWKKVKKLR